MSIDYESTVHQLSPKSLAKLPVLTRSPPWPSWFSRRHRTKSQDSHHSRNSERSWLKHTSNLMDENYMQKRWKMKHIKCTLNMKSTTNTENEKLHSRSQRLRNKESGNWCQQDGIIFKWEKKNTAGTKQVLWEYWTREEWLLLENLWTDNYFSQSYTSLQYTLSKANQCCNAALWLLHHSLFA